MTISAVPTKAIFDTAKSFFATLDRDLADPSTKAQYESGSKDSYLESVLPRLTEYTSQKILEKHAKAQSNDSEGVLAARELDLMVAVYYETVTATYDLAKIRTNDLGPAEGLTAILAEIREQLAALTEVEQLDELRSNLSKRTKWYTDKPELKKTVQAGAATLSAAYSVYPSKAVTDYQNQEVLAEPKTSDVVLAEISTLPNGLDIDSTTGMIFVADKTALQAGEHSLNVTTADEKGGLFTHILNLKLGLEETPLYQMAPPVQFNALEEEDDLAVLVDTSIVASVSMHDGTLPPGVMIDPVTGRIYVARKSAIRAGSWAASVKTVDLYNKEMVHTLSFNILGDTSASYTVRDPRDLHEYEDGTLIASAFDADGKIMAAEVTGMPPGIDVNPESGELYVSNSAALEAGTYLINLTLLSSTNEKMNHVIELVLEPGVQAPTYVVHPPAPLSEYQIGLELGHVLDSLAPIVFAKLEEGELPPGVALDPNSGRLTVGHSPALKTGVFALTISSVNLSGFRTVHKITLQIGTEPVYFPGDPKPSDQYSNGEVLATAYAPGAPINFAQIAGGSLPPGASIDAASGEIIVSNASALQQGQYSATITLRDTDSVTHTVPVVIEILTASGLVYSYSNPKAISLYESGERVAWIAANFGEVIAANVTQGMLPLGLEMNSVNGTITVSDPASLFAGTYVGIEVTAMDIYGGSSVVPLTLRFLPVPVIVYETILPTLASDLGEDDSLAFISQGSAVLAAAQLIGGSVPDGTSFHMVSGELTVISPSQLVPGDFEFEILTVSTSGEKKQHQLSLSLLEESSQASSNGTYYDVITNLAYEDNQGGEIVAKLMVEPGLTYATCSLKSGTIPDGLFLEGNTGNIVISDPEAVLGQAPGVNVQLSVDIWYTDETNEAVPVPLVFNIEGSPDQTAPPPAATSYSTSLVPYFDSIFGESSSIGIALDKLQFPGELSLDAARNLIYTDNPEDEAGTYGIQFVFQGAMEGTHPSGIVLSYPDRVPSYLLNGKLNISDLNTGEILAMPLFLDKTIKYALLQDGSDLPEGTAWSESTGILTVTKASRIIAQSYQLNILLGYNEGGENEIQITLTFKP